MDRGRGVLAALVIHTSPRMMLRVALDFGLGQRLLGRLLHLLFLLPFETRRSLLSSISFSIVFALISIFAAYHCFFSDFVRFRNFRSSTSSHRIGYCCNYLYISYLFSAFDFVILCDPLCIICFVIHLAMILNLCSLSLILLSTRTPHHPFRAIGTLAFFL